MLAPDLEGVYLHPPSLPQKTMWIHVETTSYLENKAVRRTGTQIFCSPAKNWSRQVLWLFGLDTFDFQWIFACYSWRVPYLAWEVFTCWAHGLLVVHALPGLIVVCWVGGTNLSFCRDVDLSTQNAHYHTVFIVRQNNNFFVNLLHHGHRSCSSVIDYFKI
jgi:hypothetical protein